MAPASAVSQNDEFPSPCPKGPCGKPQVLLEHKWFNGPVVIQAYTTGLDYPCLEVRREKQGSYLSGCGPSAAEPPPTGAIAFGAQTVNGLSGDDPRIFSTFGGRVRKDVTRVIVRYLDPSGTKTLKAKAAVGQVDRKTQRRLDLPKRFGVVDLVARGCINPATTTAFAYNEKGRLVGKASAFTPALPTDPCDEPPPTIPPFPPTP